MIRDFILFTEDLKRPRNPPRFTFHGQQRIYRLKYGNAEHEHQGPVSPSKHPHSKQCREIDTNIQETLYSRTVQRRKVFSYSIMGQTLTAGNNQYKPAQSIKKPFPHLSLYSHFRII